ncbi:uncharacterized protein [Typha latifolia]|uniref:uncharacterized protein n=1 Tax=Typha latifolia TaxID=4733 RepID=UPI003C2EB701
MRKEVLDRCRDLNREHQPEVMVLLKTHVDWDRAAIVAKALGRCWSWFAVPAVGVFGGLLLLWKAKLGRVDVVALSRYAAHFIITPATGETWRLTAVYASNHLAEQRSLWEELMQLSGIGSPWVVAGDFNAYLHAEEKKSFGMVELGPKAKAFATFVDSAGLCDLGFSGLPYT